MGTVDILRAPNLRCRAINSSNNSEPEGCVPCPFVVSELNQSRAPP